MDRHQGILKCRSQPGEGTEFWIQIPVNCAMVDAAEEQNSTSTSPITTESSPTRDADGFIASTVPMLKPTDLLICHTQLIQRLSQHSPEVEAASPDQIYQMFQRHPIS